ncbi:MAG: dienelactone hydrolase family protein [Dehalococcoidia bacterium]
MDATRALQAETVYFSSGGMRRSAYLALPCGTGLFPVVVVIHEIFGLNDHVRGVARRFADAGYMALAVDLFEGGNRVACMVRLMSGLLLDSLGNSGVRVLKDALTYLAARPEADETRLGAIGFCMGGGFALAWACTDDRLKAIAPYYATNPRPLHAVARACPVVGSYPEKDFTAGAARKLDAALERYSTPHDIKIYPGTKHSFFNDQGRTYAASAAEDSWGRVLAFFGEHMR